MVSLTATRVMRTTVDMQRSMNWNRLKIGGIKMKTSETVTNITPALIAVCASLGAVVKSANNPFFKSKYADLTSVIAAIKPACNEHGLMYLQFPHSDERGVGILTRIIHESGEFIEHEFTVPCKADPQGAGSALTYCRRYALVSIFGLPAVDDDAESAMLRTAPAAGLSDVIAGIESSKDLDELAELFKKAWKTYPNNRPELTAVKDTRKKELSE